MYWHSKALSPPETTLGAQHPNK